MKWENEETSKRFRKIIILLIIMGVFALLGILSEFILFFVNNQYTAFLINSLGLLSLSALSITFCLFFLYGCFVIGWFNPQHLKKSVRMGWGLGGMIPAMLIVFIVIISTKSTMAIVNDVNDYNAGNWQKGDVVIEEIYWGTYVTYKNGLITTNTGEFTLPVKSIKLRVGESYQITYLKHTNTIIEVKMN